MRDWIGYHADDLFAAIVGGGALLFVVVGIVGMWLEAFGVI